MPMPWLTMFMFLFFCLILFYILFSFLFLNSMPFTSKKYYYKFVMMKW